MRLPQQLAVFILLVATSLGWADDKTRPAQSKTNNAQSDKIREELVQVVAKEKIPGMIAAISSAEGVLSIASAGVRKSGSEAAITNEDLFHIGSCTKAMTSTVLATLVADGKLKWETTLIDVFPEFKEDIHADYHGATLWQLVTHRSGVAANAQDWWSHGATELKARRLAILKDNLKQKSATGNGEYLYSNLGYMIAGCMAERVTGDTWESLIKARLFEPLGMKSAEFGPPGVGEQTDQPWGHIKSGDDWQPRRFDNTEALGPAGRVHCTLDDWSKFIALQLTPDKPPVLNREMLNKLIEPTAGDYAAGWIVTQRPWANGLALTHSGSNTMWYATVWVAPKLNRAYLVATNSSAENSHTICDTMIGKLIAIDRDDRRE